MPISSPWHPLSALEVSGVPERAGVYELGDARQEVVYVGRAGGGNLQQRLHDHINDSRNPCIRQHARWFGYEVTVADVSRESQLLDEYKWMHGGKLPLCNTVSA
jgi:excinuclease UvrABC nuclease subunit